MVTGKTVEVDKLCRFTVFSHALVFDRDMKNPGRGGYVLKDRAIVEKLPKMKGRIKHFMNITGSFEIAESEIEWVKTLF